MTREKERRLFVPGNVFHLEDECKKHNAERDDVER